MKTSGTNQRKLIFFSTLLAGGVSAAAYFLLMASPRPLTMESWVGNWEVMYYYEHEPNYLYNGILHIENPGDMQGDLALNLPRSSKQALTSFEIEAINDGPFVLVGTLTHKSYMIQGGYPTEQVELMLDSHSELSGRGRCLEYCAEGTREWNIIWVGKKMRK